MNNPQITVISAPTQAQNLLGHYAGFMSRLLAEAVDTLLVSISFVAITWFVSVTATMLQVRSFLGFSINAIPGSATFIETLFGPAVGSLLTILYVAAYHVLFWSLTGQTPGKALLGLRVVTRTGDRPSPWRSLVRFLGYLLSGIPLYLGFFSILVDDRRQGWHDKLAGTYVVYTWAARPDERFLVDQIRQVQDTPAMDSIQQAIQSVDEEPHVLPLGESSSSSPTLPNPHR